MNGAYYYDNRANRPPGPGPVNNWSVGGGRGSADYGSPGQFTGSRPGVSQGVNQGKDVKESLGYNDTSGVYEMDHLATFTLPPNQSKLSPTDAVRKLYDLDASLPSSGSGGGPSGGPGGIWTMRVYLCVEPMYILVLDAASLEEMERFPINLLSDPASVTPRGGGSGVAKFSNIVLFTVLEDPGKGSPTEMHLFQCLGGPGQKVVDDILASMAGTRSTQAASKAQLAGGQQKFAPAVTSYGTPSRNSTDSLYKDFSLNPEVNAQVAMKYKPDPAPRERFRQSMRYPHGAPVPKSASTSSTSSSHRPVDQTEITERCITLLDHCFSDIESFVGKLVHAAVAYNELDRRKTVRGNKGGKHIGDGLLGMRSRPPPAKEFIDILQKFKLSFILLAKLKGHIRDPNAPELVHFLFNPLQLVVETSRGGTTGGSPDLASRVVTPLLTPEARDLLDNCLTSKETELWRSLGPAWTTASDRWEEEIQPFSTQFYDGWQPPSFWLDDIDVPTVGSGPSHIPVVTPTVPQSLQNKFQEPTGRRSSPLPAQQAEYAAASLQAPALAPGHIQDFNNGIYGTQQQLQQQQAAAEDKQSKQKKGWNLFGSKPSSSSKSSEAPASSSSSNADKPKAVPPPVMEKSKKGPPPPTMAKPASSGIYNMGGPASSGLNGTGSHGGYGGPIPMSGPLGSSSPMGPTSSMGGPGPMAGPMGGPSGVGGTYLSSIQEQFAQHLISTGAPAYRVIEGRQASNAKELSVSPGEIVEVLDDTRNWWSVRNHSNQSGFVPKTLLEKL